MSTSTTSNHSSITNFDERDRQIQQAEMIRQYLLLNNVEPNLPSMPALPTEKSVVKTPPATTIITSTRTKPNLTSISTQKENSEVNASVLVNVPPLSIDFPELRKDLKLAEERVERLRQELKDLQKKREESFSRPPPPYIAPTLHQSTVDTQQLLLASQRSNDGSTSPPSFVSEFYSNSNPVASPSTLRANLNLTNRFLTSAAGVSKDQRQRQFLVTMYQHREQLLVYLDSLKQALNSLDRLVTLEPTQNEVHLTNMKLDTIKKKTRQLHALKSTRSSQPSPFIDHRIRQLESDLVYLLSEHQKDVQNKLELNEQRSLMLLKIMQVNEDLSIVDQQIQQIAPTNGNDGHRMNSSPTSTEFNLPNSTLAMFNGINGHHQHDGWRILQRESTDMHPSLKLNNNIYHHGI